MYTKLHTEPFLQSSFTQHIEQAWLQEALYDVYTVCSFSTFPYNFASPDSRKALDQTQTGNCVALSLYLKDWFQKRNVDSFLIPATIPRHYQLPGYLEISHVALAIPCADCIYILDPAFYTVTPICVKQGAEKNTNQCVYCDIYADECVPCHFQVENAQNALRFNAYQEIPRNTLQIHCNDGREKQWTYFLCHVTNPDEAISKFFLQCRRECFMLITHVVERHTSGYGIPVRAQYVRQHPDHVYIKTYTPFAESAQLLKHSKAYHSIFTSANASTKKKIKKGI